jgi:chromosome segregation ATPase
MVSIVSKDPPFVVSITDYPGKPPIGPGPSQNFWRELVFDLQKTVAQRDAIISQFEEWGRVDVQNIHDLEMKIKDNEGHIDRLTKDNAKLRIEIEKLKSYNNNYRIHNEGLVRMNNKLQLELETLRKTYDDFRKDHDDLNSRNQNKDKVIAELRELLQESEAANAQLLHELDRKKRLLKSICEASTQEPEAP